MSCSEWQTFSIVCWYENTCGTLLSETVLKQQPSPVAIQEMTDNGIDF